MMDVLELTPLARPSCFDFLPRRYYTAYNETPTLKGLIMNEKLQKIKQFAKDHSTEIVSITGVVIAGAISVSYQLSVQKQLKEGDWALGTLQRMYDELQSGPKAIRFHDHHFEMCELSEVQ